MYEVAFCSYVGSPLLYFSLYVLIEDNTNLKQNSLFLFFYLLLVEITGAGSRGYIFAWLTVIVVVPSSRVYVSTLFRHLSVTFPLLYLLSCLSLLFLTSYIFLTPLLTILYLTPYFLYSNSLFLRNGFFFWRKISHSWRQHVSNFLFLEFCQSPLPKTVTPFSFPFPNMFCTFAEMCRVVQTFYRSGQI